MYIKPIIAVLALPINIVTLGLFTIIINAILFAFSAFLIPGFTVQGFVPALIGSILFSIFSVLINSTDRRVHA